MRLLRRAPSPSLPCSRLFLGLCLTLAPASLGCLINPRPLVLPPRSTPYIAVLSSEMPEPITEIARHAWIIANHPKEEGLLRYELGFGAGRFVTTSPLNYLFGKKVALHGVHTGEAAEIAKIIKCLDEETPRYNKEHGTYIPIPGPNSNTFVDQAMRRCHIHFELPATAIGKDYRGVLSFGPTTGGTGLQLESWLGGVKIGLTEGIEVHLLGISIGIDLWPPALIVPMNPGRLGFDDW
jgi:hypothetical protein